MPPRRRRRHSYKIIISGTERRRAFSGCRQPVFLVRRVCARRRCSHHCYPCVPRTLPPPPPLRVRVPSSFYPPVPSRRRPVRQTRNSSVRARRRSTFEPLASCGASCLRLGGPARAFRLFVRYSNPCVPALVPRGQRLCIATTPCRRPERTVSRRLDTIIVHVCAT